MFFLEEWLQEKYYVQNNIFGYSFMLFIKNS